MTYPGAHCPAHSSMTMLDKNEISGGSIATPSIGPSPISGTLHKASRDTFKGDHECENLVTGTIGVVRGTASEACRAMAIQEDVDTFDPARQHPEENCYFVAGLSTIDLYPASSNNHQDEARDVHSCLRVSCIQPFSLMTKERNDNHEECPEHRAVTPINSGVPSIL